MATRLVLALLLGLALAGLGDHASDPIAAEVERLTAFIAGTTATDELWTDIKPGAESALARTTTALDDGRRLLALQRLASARINLAAAEYLFARSPEQRTDEAAFEAEWTRMREELARGFGAPDFDALIPAAVRAQAEAAFCEVPILHASSLDYGHATDFETGLFYLGQARAQLEFADLCRTLDDESAAAARPPPPLRDLDVELDALETRILSAYVPPAAIDRHPEFITVSSLLKEARELNARALRRGALLEYLHAVMRFATLRAAIAADTAPAGTPADAPPDATVDATAQLAASLEQAAARFAADEADQSLGALFVETAQAELAAAAASATPGQPTPLAAAIVSDVLPAYAAAVGPAPAAPERVASQLDLTLVRWPFT